MRKTVPREKSEKSLKKRLTIEDRRDNISKLSNSGRHTSEYGF